MGHSTSIEPRRTVEAITYDDRLHQGGVGLGTAGAMLWQKTRYLCRPLLLDHKNALP